MKTTLLTLIILLGLSTFMYGQEEVVVLPKRVALFYAQRHELAKTQEIQLSIKDSIINSYEVTEIAYENLVDVHRQDSIAFQGAIAGMRIEVETYKQSETYYKGRAKKMKRQRNLVGLTGIVIIILLLL